MSVLIDTSVWVAHFRDRNEILCRMLENDQALVHPMIVGEIACGTPPNRRQVVKLLGNLKPIVQASLGETLTFVERGKLFGRGCGLIDLMLLTSVKITEGSRLWTQDKSLQNMAEQFNLKFDPAMYLQ